MSRMASTGFIVKLVRDGAEPQIFRFATSQITIGRRRDNHLVLDHPHVSEHHMRLTERDGHVDVDDLGSDRGTFVDDTPVGRAVVARGKEVIKVGPYALELLASEPPGEVEQGFLDALTRNPRDDETRSVYCDWLEMQGRVEACEFIRTQLALDGMTAEDPRFQQLSSRLRTLAPSMPNDWRRTLSRPPIENCDVRFELVCPKRWDAMSPTASPKERYCDGCKKNVHYAATVTEASTLARQGHCVAVDVAQPRAPNDLWPAPMMAGYIAPPSPPPELPKR
jgi:uncharacterized protein (TIGR02996 family)